MRCLALALLLPLLSPPADACAPPHLVDVPLLAEGATLLGEGGLVIETRNGGGDGGELERGVTLMADGKALAATLDYVAPGLSVLRPPPGDGRTITVIDWSKKVRLTLKQQAAKGKPAAPKLTGMTSTLPRAAPTKEQLSRRYGVEGSSAVLTLTAAPTADAIAVVVYRVTKQGTQGVAWFQPEAKQLVYQYSTGGKGCVPGPSPLHQGERIAVAFLDRNGRTSALSKVVAVGAPRPAKR
jgi:hypothetical protein